MGEKGVVRAAACKRSISKKLGGILWYQPCYIINSIPEADSPWHFVGHLPTLQAETKGTRVLTANRLIFLPHGPSSVRCVGRYRTLQVGLRNRRAVPGGNKEAKVYPDPSNVSEADSCQMQTGVLSKGPGT